MAKQPVRYLVLTCPSCKVRFRIRESHAHLRGRCPECAYKIDPPRPKTLESEAPGELAPVTEEWPEPPKLVSDSREMKKSQTSGKPNLSRSSYSIQKQEINQIKKAKTPPPEEEDEEDDEEEDDLQPPTIWTNVFEFPMRLENLRTWLLLAIGVTCLALLGAYLHTLLMQFVEGGQMTRQFLFRIIPYPIAGFIMLMLFTFSYLAVNFEAIIQETAAGSDRVKWPDDSLMERMIRLFYLAWLLFVASIPMGVIFLLGRNVFATQPFAWLALFPPSLILFPFVLLSSMLNASPWLIWNGQLIVDLMQKPIALFVLIATSVCLFFPCALLCYFAVMEEKWAVAPIFGLAVPACMMIYARLLGRIAWLVTEGKNLKRWRRRVLLEREREA